MSIRKKSEEIVFFLKDGDWAFPVEMKSHETNNVSFRSAAMDVNTFGYDWVTCEVEVTERKMVDDVLNKGRRTRSVATRRPNDKSLRGADSDDVRAVYLLKK